ncbi:MAG TPA: hypothetical protein VKA68_08275 [bacterium]|nr:hypothetical protein [bacterium]
MDCIEIHRMGGVRIPSDYWPAIGNLLVGVRNLAGRYDVFRENWLISAKDEKRWLKLASSIKWHQVKEK